MSSPEGDLDGSTLLKLDPISFTSLQSPTTTSPSSTWLKTLQKTSQELIDSLPDWPAGKTYGKELKIQTRSRPKEKGKGERFAWHGRESFHECGFETFRMGLFEGHSEAEREYIKELTTVEKLDALMEEEGGKVEAWRLSYTFSFPTSDREFIELIVTVDTTPSQPIPSAPGHLGTENLSGNNTVTSLQAPTPMHSVDPSSSSQTPLIDTVAQSQSQGQTQTQTQTSPTSGPSASATPKSFLVISIPLDHPKAPPRKSHVRAKYVSVEELKEVERDGKVFVRWRMATQSDPGGSIPAFVSELAIPGKIQHDVPAYLGWAKSKKA